MYDSVKPGNSYESMEEIVETHNGFAMVKTQKSPSKQTKPERSINTDEIEKNGKGNKISDTWVLSDHNHSFEGEVPIHDQIKQDILGFIENEIKKSDTKNPSYIFHEHNGPERHLKSLSRASSSHKERRSPSYRRKKRHLSKYRDRDDFDGTGLNALEKVDDYLKEYNNDEVVTLSGELEYDQVEVDKTIDKERHNKRKNRKKNHNENRRDKITNENDSNPKVFKIGKNPKNDMQRPTELSGILCHKEATTPYQEQCIDNPFSSPSPLTSPNEDWFNPFNTNRSNKIYLQKSGTFKAVAREKMFGNGRRQSDEQKYLRLGTLTPLDIALLAQSVWQSLSVACFGLLAGLALMHIILITCSDAMDPSHRLFHSHVTMPYVMMYYILCICCLLSCLDRLDVTSIDWSQSLQSYMQAMILVLIYTICLILCGACRGLDEIVTMQHYIIPVETTNFTRWNATEAIIKIPQYFQNWSHLSISRAVLTILGLMFFIITSPQDLVYINLSKLLQFKHSLQSIG